MKHASRRGPAGALVALPLALFALCAAVHAEPPAAVAPAGSPPYQVDVAYSKLPNGLRVVLSRDTTAPLAVVAVYYNIGFRIEPKDRTGFAHLFEHMKASAIAAWLEEPNRAFRGLKPLEVIERGEVDRIWRMVFELESGTAG